VLASIDAPRSRSAARPGPRPTLASVRGQSSNRNRLTANRNNILPAKADRWLNKLAGPEPTADAKAKEAVGRTRTKPMFRQLEAMQSFKTLAAPFDGVVKPPATSSSAC